MSFPNDIHGWGNLTFDVYFGKGGEDALLSSEALEQLVHAKGSEDLIDFLIPLSFYDEFEVIMPCSEVATINACRIDGGYIITFPDGTTNEVLSEDQYWMLHDWYRQASNHKIKRVAITDVKAIIQKIKGIEA